MYTTFIDRQASTVTPLSSGKIRVNELCSSSSRSSAYAQEVCSIPDSCTYPKFVWFLIDGYPQVRAGDLFRTYQEHSQVFLVYTPGFQYSHAIYTSYLTGEAATNYKGVPIHADTWLHSVRRAPEKFNMEYVGPAWSFLKIAGEESERKKLFLRERVRNEPVKDPLSHAFPVFFEGSSELLEKELDAVAAAGSSLIATSGVFDHVQHDSPPNYPSVDELSQTVNQDLARIKKWIDAHPDYLLIISSDHGVDAHGDEGFVLHGRPKDGNEAFWLFYNPDLPTVQEKILIDVVDAAALVSSFLRGADIPYNSLGHVRTQKLRCDDQSQLLKRLKQNFLQLAELADLQGLDRPDSATIVGSGDIAVVENAIVELKGHLYAASSPPNFYFFLSMIVAVFGILSYIFLLDIHHESLLTKLFVSFVTFSVVGVHFLFIWWRWKRHFIHNNIPTQIQTFVGAGVCLVLRRAGLRNASYVVMLIEVLHSSALLIKSLFGDDLIFEDFISPAIRVLVVWMWYFLVLWALFFMISSKISFPKWQIVLLGACGGLFGLYELCREFEWYLGPVHFLALVACVPVWALAFYVMFSRGLSASSSGHVPSIVLFACLLFAQHSLLLDTFVGRMYALFGAVYVITLPLVISFHEDPLLVLKQLDYWKRILLLLYTFTSLMFVYGTLLGMRINLSVLPSAGRVGLATHDALPLLNGLMMGYHKFSLFILFPFALFWMQKIPRRNSLGSFAVLRSDPSAVYLLFVSICIVCGYLGCLVFEDNHHAVEEALCVVLVACLQGIFYHLLQLWDIYILARVTVTSKTAGNFV